MPSMSWFSLLALIAAGSLLLVVLFVGLSMAFNRSKIDRKPLHDHDLPQSHDDVDPWAQAGRRHGLDD